MSDDDPNQNNFQYENKGESKQKENSINNDEDVTFFFFYNLAKKMVLKRKEIGDIYTFSIWLKALEQNNNKIIRDKYMKLMIMALQYPEPTCPFKDPPPEVIDPLENEVFEMSRKFRRKEGTAICTANEHEDHYPSMSTAVSNDKCQYASSHVIPNVGVQCFYAFSDEPLYNWTLPTQITVPKNGPHAKDIEWERALAGIQLQSYNPKNDNLENNIHSYLDAKQDDDTRKSNFGSNKKKIDPLKVNEDLDLCQVMYIEQLNRNVTEEFGWNDASLLTGEIIVGAESCSDRKIDVQVKTQVGIDEESVKVYEKLYPGDFKIFVEPSFVEDMMPARKALAMEAGDKNMTNEPQCEGKCAKKLSTLDDYHSKLPNNGKMGNDNKKVLNSKNYRQCAGGENIKLHKDQNYRDKKQKNPKNKKLKASSDLSNVKSIFKSNETLEIVKPKFMKCVDASTEEISNIQKQPSEYDYYIDQFNKRKIAFERDSSDFQRRISTAEESVQRANARSKSAKNTNDIDLGSSDAS